MRNNSDAVSSQAQQHSSSDEWYRSFSSLVMRNVLGSATDLMVQRIADARTKLGVGAGADDVTEEERDNMDMACNHAQYRVEVLLTRLEALWAEKHAELVLESHRQRSQQKEEEQRKMLMDEKTQQTLPLGFVDFSTTPPSAAAAAAAPRVLQLAPPLGFREHCCRNPSLWSVLQQMKAAMTSPKSDDDVAGVPQEDENEDFVRSSVVTGGTARATAAAVGDETSRGRTKKTAAASAASVSAVSSSSPNTNKTSSSIRKGNIGLSSSSPSSSSSTATQSIEERMAALLPETQADSEEQTLEISDDDDTSDGNFMWPTSLEEFLKDVHETNRPRRSGSSSLPSPRILHIRGAIVNNDAFNNKDMCEFLSAPLDAPLAKSSRGSTLTRHVFSYAPCLVGIPPSSSSSSSLPLSTDGASSSSSESSSVTAAHHQEVFAYTSFRVPMMSKSTDDQQ